MDKLEEYKISKVTSDFEFGYNNPEFTPLEIQAYRETLKYYWKTGFDAAIALDLPVKFAEWLWSNVDEKEMANTSWQDLYKNWIENIYNPE